MLKDLRLLLFSGTSKDTSVLFLGTVFSTILNLLIVLILTRNLSTSDFGLFITALVFMQLVGDMFELGVNSATLGFLPKLFGPERLSYLGQVIILKSLISVVVGVLVFLLAPFISINILNSEQILPLVRISSFGILFLMVITWYQTFAQVERKFFLSSLINLSPNVLRFLTLAIVLLLGFFNLGNAFYFYNLVLLIVVLFIGYRLRSVIFKLKVDRVIQSKILKFSLPIGLGFAAAAIYTRLDQLMIIRLVGEDEAALYGLASRLATVFVFAVASLTSAMVPRVVGMAEKDFKSYFKKIILVDVFLVLLAIVVMIFAPLIPLIFGDSYKNSMVPFQIMMIGMIFFTLSAPFSSIIVYRFKKTVFSFYLSLGSLVLVFVLLNLLVPIYKGNGAAFTLTLIYILQFLICLLYYKKLTTKS